MNKLHVFLAVLILSFGAQAQKRNIRPSPPAAADAPEPTRPKKNGRPAAVPTVAIADFVPVYFYEFTRPEFVVSDVRIEHDAAGRGIISFKKRDFDEFLTDPLTVSKAAMERIDSALAALDFLNSVENYQHEKDYSHLGNITYTVKKDGKRRTVNYNWSGNEHARALAEEYRKLGNQYIWIFDITVARENQPLETPRLLDALDSLHRRKELSDPAQMIPFLRALATDERLPLIARNHTTKLIARIEKD